MSLVISDEIIRASHLTEKEIKLELAVTLFQKSKLTLGQAGKFAEMSLSEFQQLLGSRKISANYDMTAYHEDVNTIKKLSL